MLNLRVYTFWDTFCIFLTFCLFVRVLWHQGHGVLADILAQMGKAPHMGFSEGVGAEVSLFLLVGAKDNLNLEVFL